MDKYKSLTDQGKQAYIAVLDKMNILKILILTCFVSCQSASEPKDSVPTLEEKNVSNIQTSENNLSNNFFSAFYSDKLRFEPIINLDVVIALNDSIFSSCSDIKINITLTNNLNSLQRFIFFNPKDIPKPVSLEVLDKNNVSMVKIHRAFLSSQLWTKEELEEHYTVLEPQKSVQEEFYLTNIVVLQNPDDDQGYTSHLADGTYKLSAQHGMNYSEIHTFTIDSSAK